MATWINPFGEYRLLQRSCQCGKIELPRLWFQRQIYCDDCLIKSLKQHRKTK